MARTVTISLDAMGGDHGPGVVVPGAALALERHPDARFIMFGNEAAVAPLLDAHPKLKAATTLHHTEIAVAMDAKPSQALRQGRYKSSMWKAIEAVKTGDAAVCVSAGNTGALGAMSRFCLRSMANVERPALACLWPTLRGESVVLDVGATIGADAGHLVDLAVMGAAMAHVVLNIDRPSVGLLNVGVEEIKGNEEVKAAGQILRDINLPLLDYRGYVEGDDLGKGTVDVVVTEGFTGNIALKAAEGTAKQIGTYLKTAMTSTLFSKIGYLFARSAFAALKDRMDPRKVNGGVFLGLEGIVIKSHGGTDAIGFSAAIDTAYDMASHDLMAQIRTAVAAAERPKAQEAPAAEAG